MFRLQHRPRECPPNDVSIYILAEGDDRGKALALARELRNGWDTDGPVVVDEMGRSLKSQAKDAMRRWALVAVVIKEGEMLAYPLWSNGGKPGEPVKVTSASEIGTGESNE